MKVTLLQIKDLPWNDIGGFGTMYLFTMPFVILGIFVFFRKYRKNPGAVFIFFFFLTGVFCGLFTNGVNVNRINIIYYPVIIYAGIGMYESICCFVASRVCLPVVYAVAFILFTNTYFTTYASEIRGYFHGDFSDALDASKDMDVDKYYITNYCNAYDLTQILVLFHHCVDAKYFQGKTDDGGLPFAQKYTISPMGEVTINPEENAVYVVSSAELACFDTTLYKMQQYGDYYVLLSGKQKKFQLQKSAESDG